MQMRYERPWVGIVLGDHAGIGPEIVLKLLDRFVVIVEKNDVGIIKRSAYRYRLIFAKRSLRLPIARHSRCLGRTVEIEKSRVGKRRSPKVVLLSRKHLTAKGNGGKIFWGMLRKSAKRGYLRQRRYYPANGVYPVGVKIFHKSDRK